MGEVDGRAGRREWEETESLRGKATLPRGHAQGPMSLATIKRLLGGQEVERPVEQAICVYLASWRGG